MNVQQPLYKNFKNKKEVISKKEAQKDNQTLNNENKELAAPP